MTEFRGRGDEVHVYPLTFKEFYDYLGGDKSERFEEYSLYGGLPLTLSKKLPKIKLNIYPTFLKKYILRI